MTRLATPEARAYLERLRDLLPAREAGRVLSDVEGLILDRAEAAQGEGLLPADAERRALLHLGAPERLADTLVDAPWTVPLSTRRSFVRWLLVLTVGHLLLSVLLTLARAEGPAIPGLLGPLPVAPWTATLTGALGVLLTDVGLLLVLFLTLGARGGGAGLPALRVAPAWTRADALRGLALVGLLALLAHPLRDTVFAVRHAGVLHPFLAPDLLALLPWADLALGLVGLRYLLVLAGRDGTPALAADALAAAAGIVLLLLASTRSEVVRLPSVVLGPDTAHVLSDLTTRAFLVVFVGAALLLGVRLVKRLLGLRRALAG